MKRYTNAQIAEVVKYIIENVEILNNALDDALRVTEVEQQNKRYREAINNIIEKAMLFGTNEEVYEAIQDAIKALEGEE